MQTVCGERFYPLDPRADEIHLVDIAHGLAMTCRYGGHTRRFYSVAEHAVLVSHFVPPAFALHGLLHDSAETYIGDMVRPLKHQPEMIEFRRAEAAIEERVAIRFGLTWDTFAVAEVKSVDDRILVDEIRALMKRPSLYMRGPLGLLAPLGANIVGLEPEAAESAFLSRFAELSCESF